MGSANDAVFSQGSKSHSEWYRVFSAPGHCSLSMQGGGHQKKKMFPWDSWEGAGKGCEGRRELKILAYRSGRDFLWSMLSDCEY